MRIGYREFNIRSVKINLLDRQVGIFSDPTYISDTWKYNANAAKNCKYGVRVHGFDCSACELWNKFIKRWI